MLICKKNYCQFRRMHAILYFKSQNLYFLKNITVTVLVFKLKEQNCITNRFDLLLEFALWWALLNGITVYCISCLLGSDLTSFRFDRSHLQYITK